MSGGLACVIGWPARHSLSPTIHKHWLAEHKIAGDYVALPIRPGDFGRCVSALPRMGFRGASVTSPHKEAAFALSTTLDESAKATGAVNLIVFDGCVVQGRNTDVYGFTASVTEAFGSGAMGNGPAVVLGAGGAARAVVYSLALARAPEIRVLNRTRARAEALRDITPVRGFDWEDAKALEGATFLVNTSKLGMSGMPDLQIALDTLPPSAAVVDIVYKPLDTAFLRDAKARGHRTLGGLAMLMRQAVPAFAAWFGTTPQVTPELRAKLETVLRG